jgi:polysaccharide pyruvyl transferase WcaK-like protein
MKHIKKECNANDKLEILDREHNFEDFVKKIANAELVISTRLHLFLISSFLGVRTKVYPYQKKILKMQEVVRNLE